MNIVKPYAKIVDFSKGHSEHATGDNNPLREVELKHGIALLRRIEWCGRVSHRSEDAQTEDSWKRFIEAVVLGRGDWSIVEHASASVDFLVDRGITHELVRHRLFSFTQESTRFVNYEKKMPPSFISPINSNTIDKEDQERFMDWRDFIAQSEENYIQMLKTGSAPQIARSVFPNALASRIIITGNLRSWRHFLLMRTTKEAHPQMREVTIPLLEEFKTKIPLLFDDIEPLARQIDNMRKPR